MTNKRMVSDGQTSHDISHLEPFTFTVSRPADDKGGGWSIDVHATFSWHCYTRTPDASEQVHRLRNGKETRTFCPERYGYSKLLPGIVAGLSERKVLQTGKSNFVTIELVDRNGTHVDYEVYFSVRKDGKKRPLRLYVESAYVRDPSNAANRPKPRRQAIRFRVVVHNVQTGKAIKFKA